MRGRVRLTNSDRLFFIQLYRWFPSVLKAITIVRPETLVRWHRAGFRRYWRWKSRSLGGRPQIDADLRALIRRMSVDNPLWGAPRIRPSRRGGPSARGRELPANGRSGPAASPWRRISTFRCRLKRCVLLQPGLQERVHYKGAQPTFRTSLSTTREHHQRQVRPIAVRKALRSGGIADGHKEQGLNQSRQVEAIDLAGAIAGFHKRVVAELARRLRKSCKERAGRHLGPY